MNRTLAGFAVIGMFSGSVATFAVASPGSDSVVDGADEIDRDTEVSDTNAPDTPAPDTPAPDSPAPDTAAPDTSTPDDAAATPGDLPPTTTEDAADTTAPSTSDPEPNVGRSSIGDLVFFDADADGLFTDGDSGLVGVGVSLAGPGPDRLVGTADDVFASTTTDDEGAYLFSGLDAGEYRVTIDLSTVDSNVRDRNTADADGGADSASELELGVNTADLTIDFGYTTARVTTEPTTSIEVELYSDVDRSGGREMDEPAFGDQLVTVRTAGVDGVFDTADDVVMLATTADDGRAVVTGLDSGLARVSVSGAVVDGLENLEDPDGGGDRAALVNIAEDEELPVQLFGFAEAADDVDASNDDDVADPANDELDTANDDADAASDEAADVDEAGGVDGGAEREDNTIGGVVWRDVNGDATPGDSEPRLAGVEIRLIDLGADAAVGGGDDREVGAAVTETNGRFQFDRVGDGQVAVQVVGGTPVDLALTSDPDDTETPDGLSEHSIGGGQVVLDVNFGFAAVDIEGERVGAIGDTVFLDLDGNGRHGEGEPGVPGQTVELIWSGPDGILGSPDDEASNATTDAAGQYLFDSLPDGEYTVTVRSGIVLRATNSGDPDGGANSTSSLTLSEGARERLDHDFGYLGSNGVGDTVFLDSNGNGVDDGRAGDPGVAGAKLSVTWLGTDAVSGTADDIVLTSTTNGDGRFSVLGLPDGKYVVELDPTSLPSGSFVSIDPDAGTADGRSSITLESGTVDVGQDFGIAAGTATVGDTVWLDLDRDGNRDIGEPGLTGAMVELSSAGSDGVFGTDDDFVLQTQADTAGQYLFEALPASSYVISVSGLSAGMSATADADGFADGMTTVTLEAGETDLSKDFGFVGDSGAGDTVFVDVDRDGVRDAGEPGEANLVMLVVGAGLDGALGTDDDLGVRTSTSNSGLYLVTGLPAGEVQVSYDTEDLSAGRAPVSDSDGGDPTLTIGMLVSGELNLNFDFVIADADVEPAPVETGGITGSVFHDPNRNGLRDADELGVGDVTVVLRDTDEREIDRIATTNDGVFRFDDLRADDYVVVLDATSLPTGTDVVTETDGDVDRRAAVTVMSGATVPAGNFGIASTGTTPTNPAAPTNPTPVTPTQPTNLPASGTDSTALISQLAVAALMAGMGVLLLRRRPEELLDSIA